VFRVWAGEPAQQVPDNQRSTRLASFLPGLSRAAPGFIQLVVEENAPDAGHAGQGSSRYVSRVLIASARSLRALLGS